MPKVLDANFEEELLLPPRVEDWLLPESPARFIREFVDGLDEAEFALRRAKEENPEGRPAYSLKLLLRVWLYAYLCRLRSSRKVEAACRERLDFIWLSGNLQPDHNTLWRFWQTHREIVTKLFRRTVKVACELKLVGLVLQAVDGTKIQAACSGRQGWDQAALQKALARLEEFIAAQEKEIAAAGEEAAATTALPAELRSAQVLKEKVAAALQTVQAGETKYCHPLEPDARRVGCDGRNRFGYNAQAVVDGQERVILAAELSNEESDMHQLHFMLQQAEANAGAKAAQSAADGGYCNGPLVAAAQAEGHDLLIPIPGDPKTPEDQPYHTSRFVYDPASDTFTCPQKRVLRFRRVRERNGAPVREYHCAGAVCRACPLFGQCTKNKAGRTIEQWPWSDVITAHRAKMSTPAAAETYRKRSQIVETVFGWIKEAWSFRRWTWQGLEKVRAQWQLLCATSNLRVLYRAWVARQQTTPVPAAA